MTHCPAPYAAMTIMRMYYYCATDVTLRITRTAWTWTLFLLDIGSATLARPSAL
jgi:hypothetical protein